MGVKNKKNMNQLVRKINILLIAIPLLFLIAIWFYLPGYVPCSYLSEFGSYEKNGLCIIPGDLILEGKVDGLPKALHVKGNLEIRGTSISDLPSKLHVDGDVFLYKTAIGSIPKNSYIGGDFDFYLGFGSPSIYCDEIHSSVTIKGNNYCQY